MATGGSINTDILSDETFDLLCSVCKRKGKHCEAEKYCMECNEYYCLVCVKLHEDLSFLSTHKILDKGQFKTSKMLSVPRQGSGQSLPAAPTERCNKHNHYYIDMYCQNHDDVGCATCIATDHRLCKDTFYIPEFLQNNATIPTSKEIAQILEGVAKILTKSQSTLQHEKQKLLKAKADALENIRKFRKEIDDRLNKLEQNSIKEIESLYTALIEEIKKATKEVQANLFNINSAQNKLASPGNNVSQVFVNAKKGNKTAKMTSKWIEENKTQIPVVDIEFKTDQRLSKFLEELNTLGNVIQRNVQDEGNMASSSSKPLGQQITSRQNTRQKKYPANSASIQQKNVLFQGHRKKNYPVKMNSDKEKCNIVSACALDNGTIILSDNSNNKLKCLDSSTYTVTDYCDLPDRPWQVCPISKQEVAVCFWNNQVVQFISVGSTMTKTREISTFFTCYGLAYANDNLYISDYCTSVYIYSIAGSKLREFNLHLSGLGMYCHISLSVSLAVSLAVSKDGTRIYIADFHKGLIVLDNNGQVVGQSNRLQLKGAGDCYLTDTGSVIVCGALSHNILQFGPDGELIDYYTSVYIYSIAGSKLRQFYLHQSGPGLFSTIRSLAASKDSSRIYIADFKKGLIVLDNNELVVGQFNGPQLKDAYECYLTDTGSVLVCENLSHNGLQFGPSGELIGEVVKSDKNYKFQTVCCNQQMSKLIVGSDSNEIEVYDLE